MVPIIYFSGRTHIEPKDGDIRNLKEIKKINITYDNSTIGVGSFQTEKEYLDQKILKYENEEGAQKFLNEWTGAFFKYYQPEFQKALINDLKKKGIVGTNYSENEALTLKVKLLYIEPGFNAGVTIKPAFIHLDCVFIDKQENILLSYSIKNAVGYLATNNPTLPTSARITEAYKKAAEVLAKKIKKDLKKIK
jgi:hypothetical protein